MFKLKLKRNIRELVVNVVAKPGRVDDGESNANTILFKFYTQYMSSRAWTHYERRTHTDVDRLDTNAFFNMRGVCVVRNLVLQHFRLAQSIHKRRATSTRSTLRKTYTSVLAKGAVQS